MQTVLLTDLGRQPYKETWVLQESLLQDNLRRKAAGEPTVNRLLLVEHPPVYTLGKSGKMEHVLISEADRQERGIEFFHTNRGGDITFHGPGQLVGYPILDLELFGTDLGKYLRRIEEAVIRTIGAFGLQGDRSPGETGVWLEPFTKGRERKICAIGIRCSRWITMHGFALNVNTNLDYFNHIIPCGIQQKAVTSISKEIGQSIDFNTVKEIFVDKFSDIFDVEIATANGMPA
ncbi:MAG: lipoyl(octanoyl) transferase LipB [Flavihumibacter sp.]